MYRFDENSGGRGNGPETNAAPSERLRALTLTRNDTWPERQMCELVLVLNCSAVGFCIDDMEKPLCPGEMALLPLGNGLICSARGQVLSASLQSLSEPTAPQRLSDRLIEQLLRRAWASAYTCREVIEPTLSLIEILADAKMRERQEQLEFLEGLDPRIAAAVDYIDAHYSEPITVSTLARIACLSPGHFARLFKAQVGLTVWGYVQRRRCERAQEMLLRSANNPLEIARKTGFASVVHMTAAIDSIVAEQERSGSILFNADGNGDKKFVGGLTATALGRVLDWIENALAEDLSLAQLASVAGLSTWHFARCFKAETGMTPAAYVMHRRIERARIRLAGTNDSVTKIAFACGFSSSQHMATVFRRVLNTSPTAYRQEHI